MSEIQEGQQGDFISEEILKNKKEQLLARAAAILNEYRTTFDALKVFVKTKRRELAEMDKVTSEISQSHREIEYKKELAGYKEKKFFPEKTTLDFSVLEVPQKREMTNYIEWVTHLLEGGVFSELNMLTHGMGQEVIQQALSEVSINLDQIEEFLKTTKGYFDKSSEGLE